jgi:hypothetical protein
MYDKKKHPSSFWKDEERSSFSALAVPPSFANATLHRHLWEEAIPERLLPRICPITGASGQFYSHSLENDFFSRLFGVFFTNLAYGLSTDCPLSGCDRTSLLVPAKPLRYAIV